MEVYRNLSIDVLYFNEDSNGFVQKQDFQVFAAIDVSLRETLQEFLRVNLREDNFLCKGGNFMGDPIDLNKTPLEIEYITDRYRLGDAPMLFLIESGTPPDVESRHSIASSKLSPSMLRRRPSVMVKRVLETRDSGLSLDGSISSFFEIPTNSSQSENYSPSMSNAQPEPVFLHIGDDPSSSSSNSEDENIFVSNRSPPQRRRILQIQPAPSEPNLLTLLPSSSTLIDAQSGIKRNKTVKVKSPIPSPNTPDKTLTLPTNHSRRCIRLESSPELPSSSRAFTMVPRSYNHKPSILSPQDIPPPVERRLIRRRVIRIRSTDTFYKLPYVLKLTIDRSKLNGSGAADNWSTSILCNNFTTVGELGQLVNRALLKCGKMESANPSLIYVVDGQKHELFNEAQFLQNTHFYAREMKGRSTDNLKSENLPQLMVTFPHELPYHEMATYYRISQMTGILLDTRVSVMGKTEFNPRILPVDMSEAIFARRTLHDYIVQVTDERDEEAYALSTEVITDDAPTFLTLKIPLSNQIIVTFHYKNQFSFAQKVGIHSLASDILCQILPCLVACGLVKDKIEDYTLKMSGEECYIHGSVELIAFKAIRRCIVKNEPIHLSVAPKPAKELYRRFNSSWLLLDSFTCMSQSHSEVSKVYQPNTQSAWECDKDFELEVSRVENLPFSMNKISVEISLHLGAKQIHAAKNVGWFRQDSYTIHCNKKETFFTKIKNIPKAAKVLVLVRSSTSKVFYWGLISVYDHLGRFQSGTHVLHLWNSKSGKDSFKNTTTSLIEDEVTSERLHSFLAGPVFNNPCSTAVRATINFGVHEQPIFFPSTSKESLKQFFFQHRASRSARMRRYLAKYLPGQSSSKCFKKLANDLQQGVNWTDFRDCLEVYNLLEELKKDLSYIREHVGLQLLDSNFPDETVRAFAVYVLESKLSDESLEAYLLQLTQALKFEPNHDSALARYLLRKALTNKRIGHFFFWYLKSEIRDLSVKKCSPCSVRFAVILEAYLKGCGEAMLTRYVDQVEMERALKEIRLKLHSPDRSGKGDVEKMQESLHGELKRMELEKYSFYPVFNPRLKMGKMRIDKCKIIGSAKRPMWLELLNVDSTALNKDPVRVIFKTGDDLRQDMITLRMFGLFENLWENEGLDLRLIPYGCMATGMNSGFIEVVKNAKTIKEVSGVRENHKLYEWIKGHQKNEFGEENPEKVKQAIKTFIHSCAGYSVATYILGIGDRHNDNIMVTTSGNLFHIDFGHFLGNIKHFMGFKKEWAPFVLTPDFVYVMGGEGSANFEYYKHLCCRAFLILRRNADLIINLIAMMRSTGIPELTCVEDTEYVRNALALNKTDTQAEQCFKNVIKKCLSLTWTVQVVWAAHIVINGSRLNKSES